MLLLLVSSLSWRPEWASVDALAPESIPAVFRQDAAAGDHDLDLRRLQTRLATREAMRSSHQQRAVAHQAVESGSYYGQLRGLSPSHCADDGLALATVGHRTRGGGPI